MSDTDTRIAGIVSQLAQMHDISLKDLADQLQLPYRSVQNYLTGKVKIPAFFIERCCTIFRVEADYLIFGRVGVDVIAIEDAVRSVLSEVIPRLELDGRMLVVGRDNKPLLSERSQFHHDAAILGEIAMAIQEHYERVRPDAVKEHGRGNISARAQAVGAGLVSPNWHD